MKRTVKKAQDPKYMSDGSIELLVEFEELPEDGLSLFVASPKDCTAHGPEIFKRAKSGEFGAVAKYVPPSTEEANNDLARVARRQRDRNLSACDWTQLPDVSSEVKTKYAEYRQKLRDITDQAGFPTKIEWPVKPE